MSVLKSKRRIEAPPERPHPARLSNVTPGRLGCAPGTSRSVIDTLMADDPSPAEQVRALKAAAERKIWAILHMGPLTTDWSARLDADWTHVDARWDNLADGTARELGRHLAAAQYAPRVAIAPLLSELTELVSVRLPEWRQALTVHAEDELALYGAKAEVA